MDNEALKTGRGGEAVRDVNRWLTPDGKSLNVTDNLSRDALIELSKSFNVSVGEQSDADIRRLVAIAMVFQAKHEPKDNNLEEQAFMLICGRFDVGYAGIVPEGKLGIFFQEYTFGTPRDKAKVINELYERFWERV
jgi:hypothetical protein